MSQAPSRTAAAVFLAVYLLVALAIWLYECLSSEMNFNIPLVADFVALAVFLFLTPSISAWWFLFLFAGFCIGHAGQLARDAGFRERSRRRACHFAGAIRLAGTARVMAFDRTGTAISGLGMGFLGAR